LQSKIYKVFHEIEKQDTLNPSESDNFNSMNQLLAANSTIARIETDETGEQRIVPIVDDTHYGNLLNENAVAIIGDKAIKIIDNYKITAPKADVGLLAKTTSVENAKAWEVVQYKGNLSGDKGNYGVNQRASATHNPRWCNNDRRVFIECWLDITNYLAGIYNVSFRYRVTGERKSAGCIWYHYWTYLENRNVSCSASVNNTNVFGGTYPSENSGVDAWELVRTKSFGTITPGSGGIQGWFTKLHAEGRSGGVSSSAVINLL
jgi:hypothetical protein